MDALLDVLVRLWNTCIVHCNAPRPGGRVIELSIPSGLARWRWRARKKMGKPEFLERGKAGGRLEGEKPFGNKTKYVK